MAPSQYDDSDDEKPVSRWKDILAAGEAASKKDGAPLETADAIPQTSAETQTPLNALNSPVNTTSQLSSIAAVNIAPIELDATPISKPKAEDVKDKGKEREVEKVIAINQEVYPVWEDSIPGKDIHGVRKDSSAPRDDDDGARVLQIPAFEAAPEVDVVEAVIPVNPQTADEGNGLTTADSLKQSGTAHHDLGQQVVLAASALRANSLPLREESGYTQDNTMQDVIPGIEEENTGETSTKTAQPDTYLGPQSQLPQTSEHPEPVGQLGHDHQTLFVPDELDIDSNSNDTDSAIGDMNRALSSTASVRSSLFENIEENGRTYHKYKAGSYFLPNDEQEQARLDLQHHVWLLTLHGRLHLAPIDVPGAKLHNVLDIATGTGIWAIDFAIKNPSASVIGTDLSPIQPLYVPPNCRFEVDDAEDDWVYSHGFDYIHIRLAVVCFRSFPSVLAKAYDALHPGGYIELQDSCLITCHDNTWDGTEIKRWVLAVELAANNLGMDWQKTRKYKKWVEEAGFEEVVEQKLAQPLNTWPKGKNYKELGIWMGRNCIDACDGISKAVLTKGLGMTVEEIELLLVGVRKDIADRRIHCYAPVHVIYARKPLNAQPPVVT